MNRIVKCLFVGVIALCGTSFALPEQIRIPPKAAPFHAVGQMPWFKHQDIRQQLKMTDEQFMGLNKAYAESWKRYQQGTNSLDKNLSDQQRWLQMRDLQRDLFADFSKSSNGIFTSPEQRQRFDQMSLQFRGFDAFQDPAVQQKLKLNDIQRQTLDQFSREWNTHMGNYNRTYDTDRKGTLKRFNATQKQAQVQINSVLTPEQQKIWTQMTGEFYTFHPSVYFQSNVKTGKIGGMQ